MRYQLIALFLGSGYGLLLAQEAGAPATPLRQGFNIRSVAAYGDFYSPAFLPQIGGGASPGSADIPSDAGYGGGAQFSWLKIKKDLNLALYYSPFYTARTRYDELNFLNHSFSFAAGGKLVGRWKVDSQISASRRSQDQFLFSPPVYSNLAAAPASFDEFAGAVLGGKLTDAQAASMLTGAPVLESPAQNLFFGQRMFSVSAGASLTYSYSPQLSLIIAVGGDRRQPIAANEDDGATASGSLVPDATTANAGITVSYSLSPRTHVGGIVGSQYVSSDYQSVPSSSIVTSGLVSLGRTVNRRWFFEVRGGVGVITPVQEGIFTVSTDPQLIGGGSIGFRTFSHTLVGSYDRRAGDAYGYSAESTSSVSGTWSWKRPGSKWWIESGLTWGQLPGIDFKTTSWLASAGFGWQVDRRVALLTQVSNLRYSSTQIDNSPFNSSQIGVRVSLVWTPFSLGMR